MNAGRQGGWSGTPGGRAARAGATGAGVTWTGATKVHALREVTDEPRTG